MSDNICPNCNSADIAEIIYGYPSEDLIEEEVYNKKVVFGGCFISSDSNEMHCNECKYEWIVNKDKIIAIIDRVIKEVWITEIKNDIENMYVLYEDTLKNAFYFHLRNRLSKLMIDNNIRIFTEFHDGKLTGKRMIADIAIVKISEDKSDHIKQNIEQIYAIIELKHKGSDVPIDCFIKDVEKVTVYIKDKELRGCQLYLGFIHEGEFDSREVSWLQDKKQEHMAQGRLTELSACYYTSSKGMIFTVVSYNGMNEDLNYTDKVIDNSI